MRPSASSGGPPAGGGSPPPRQFVLFTLYQADPAWRRLDVDGRQRRKSEFLAVLESSQKREIMTHAYSTVGMRADCELCLWRISYSLEALQEMSADLLKTGMGSYLTPTQSYLGQTKRSVYVDKLNPEHEGQRMYIKPAQSKYIFIYPFVKARDWFQLSKQARQGIMDEHIEVGVRYPSVKLNTVYSFGLDDQEWIVAFETDHPSDFLDLVMELRETEGSRYTLRDTPIITAIRRDYQQALDLMG